jgi:hypothetical protein
MNGKDRRFSRSPAIDSMVNVRKTAEDWLPGIIAGGVAFVAFVVVGHTPAIRAGALALVIAGMAMILCRFGLPLAVIGGLALALSPAFWSQTGTAADVSLPLVLIVLAVAVVLVLVFRRFGWSMGVLVGFAGFAVLFWVQFAGLGSLRITTLATVWLLYLVIDALYRTNPHPGDPPAGMLKPYHTWGILILLAIGVVNAPSFILLAPAVVLGLLLTHVRLPWWYWIALAGIIGLGLDSGASEYLRSTWWNYPAALAHAQNIRVPHIFADGWREAERWLYLVDLVVAQFTPLGVVVGIFGLARLARWYPPIGTVTIAGYAVHALFGLVYFGNNAAVLLLPLLMIQAFWMTYAFYALGDWLHRSRRPVRWFAPVAYLSLPLLLLARIANIL